MFCVECGKEGPIYKNGVCLQCYLKQAQFSKGPAILDIFFCPRCSSYKYKNIWTQDSFDEVLQRYVKDEFHISKELKNVTVNTECKEQDTLFSCIVSITGIVGDETIVEQRPLSVRIKKTTCDVCSREAGGYYEAILQIRAENRIPSKTELTALRSSVESLVGQLQISGKRQLFITDIDIKREGLDFFLSEKGTALTIAKKIQELYGGEFKQSASNVGMKDSRQLYRMTYCVRIPAYRTGDIFTKDNSFFYVAAIHGTKVRTIELKNWDEKVVDAKDMKKIKILGGNELVQEMIVVSQTTTEIQLMNPITYSTIEIKKPKNIAITEQMIRTIHIEKQVYLFPKTSSV